MKDDTLDFIIMVNRFHLFGEKRCIVIFMDDTVILDQH